MKKHQTLLTLLIISTIVLAMVGLNLLIPAETQAHPEYGFTTTPPPRPDDGDDDDDDGGGGGDDDTTPADYVMVQIDQCDLVCLYAYDGEDSASISQAPVIEVSVPVRFVHEGTGWIAEAVLSDGTSVQVPVPYSGDWEVFMIDTPQINTSIPVDTSLLNLPDLSGGPISLGIIQANTENPEMILCPVLCVIQPTPTPAAPAHLPESGIEAQTAYGIFLAGGVFLIISGLFLAYRVTHEDQ
jgi:hypothetical protein